MKTLLIVLIFFISTTIVKGQRKSDKIYWTALDKYTLALDSVNEGPVDRIIFLQKPEYVDSIPKEINGYHIVLLTPINQRKLYKDHNDRLIHTKMFPIAVEDSTMFITFTPYHGSFKHNNYRLGVSDGVTIYFKYDCLSKQFIVFKVQCWGI